jgi:hypothetical protein
MNGNEDLPGDHFWDADEAEQETSSGIYNIEIECFGCGTINHLNVTSAGDVDRAYCAGCNRRLFRETDEPDTSDGEPEEDEERYEKGIEVPAGAAFFGILGTDRYYPLESIHEFFSSTDTKQLHGELVELVYFVSEEEAAARGFAPAQGMLCPDCGWVKTPGERLFCRQCGALLEKTEDYVANDENETSSSASPAPLSSVVLGKNVETDALVTLTQDQRLKGIYVIGKTGSGKTTLLVNLILQYILQGMGVCFITPHGDAITDVLKRLPKDREADVILLDPMDKTHAFGLNLLQCSNPQDHEEVSRVISGVLEIFEKLFTQSGDLMKEAPNMAETLQMALPVLLAHTSPRMTLAEIPLLTMHQTARTKLLAPIDNLMVTSFWNTYQTWKADRQDDLTSSTRKRVNDFTLNPLILEIIGQSETMLDFRKIMDERKILLVKLPRKPEIVASLLGSVLISQIANAAFSREDTPEAERVPFNLCADEYQRFSTPTFAELLTEVRKYKIATCVAHQARGQLDHANKVATLNAGTLVVYQVSGDDAKELAPNFKRTPPPPDIEWIEIEDGVEPVQTYKRDLVTHLLHTDHPDPRVMKFVTGYLRPFRERITTFRFNPYLPLTTEEVNNIVEPAYAALRDWLFEGMVQKHMLLQTIPQEIMLPFSYAGSFVRYPKWSSGRTYQWMKEEAWDLTDRMDECIKQFTILNNKLRDEALQNPSMDEREYRACFNRHSSAWIAAFKDRFCSKGYSSQPCDEVEAERVRFDEFCMALRLCQLGLNQQPVYTTDSGHYQPRKRKQAVITQRSYPEMESKIASELANPPLPFAAHVKLGTQEYAIQALPFEKPDEESVWMARQDRIIAQTRLHYCKKREEVDKEIKARQDALIKREKPRGRTTTDEDEE